MRARRRPRPPPRSRSPDPGSTNLDPTDDPVISEVLQHPVGTVFADVTCSTNSNGTLNCTSASAGAFAGLGILLFVYLAIAVLSIVAAVKIVTKAGYSGWWVLIAFIPIVGSIFVLIFAFSTWPVTQEVETLKRQLGSGGYGAPGGYGGRPGSGGGRPGPGPVGSESLGIGRLRGFSRACPGISRTRSGRRHGACARPCSAPDFRSVHPRGDDAGCSAGHTSPFSATTRPPRRRVVPGARRRTRTGAVLERRQLDGSVPLTALSGAPPPIRGPLHPADLHLPDGQGLAGGDPREPFDVGTHCEQ